MKRFTNLAAERMLWALETCCCLTLVVNGSFAAENEALGAKGAVSVVFREKDIRCVQFIDNGRSLVFASSAGVHGQSARGEGQTVQYWDKPVFDVAGAEKGTVFVAYIGLNAAVWKLGDRVPIYTANDAGLYPQVSASGRLVAFGNKEGCLLFDTEQRSTQLLPASFGDRGLVAFPAGDGIVSYSHCHRGRLQCLLFDTKDGRRTNELNADGVHGLVRQVCTFTIPPVWPRSPSENGLVVYVEMMPVVHAPGSVLLWNVDKGWLLARMSQSGREISLSQDSNRLYTRTSEGQVAKWKLSDGVLLGFVEADGRIDHVEVSKNGKILALGVVKVGRETTARHLVIRNREEDTEAIVTTRSIESLQFSPSADRLLFVEHDDELGRDEAKLVELKSLQWRSQNLNE